MQSFIFELLAVMLNSYLWTNLRTDTVVHRNSCAENVRDKNWRYRWGPMFNLYILNYLWSYQRLVSKNSRFPDKHPGQQSNVHCVLFFLGPKVLYERVCPVKNSLTNSLSFLIVFLISSKIKVIELTLFKKIYKC